RGDGMIPGSGVAPPQDGRGRDTASLLVRVGGDGRGHEGLLDGARARPPGQVLRRTRLVVGAGGTGPTERLLTDDGAGGPVVDVEVARRETQYFLGPGHRHTVVGDDRAGQRSEERRVGTEPSPGRSTYSQQHT